MIENQPARGCNASTSKQADRPKKGRANAIRGLLVTIPRAPPQQHLTFISDKLIFEPFYLFSVYSVTLNRASEILRQWRWDGTQRGKKPIVIEFEICLTAL